MEIAMLDIRLMDILVRNKNMHRPFQTKFFYYLALVLAGKKNLIFRIFFYHFMPQNNPCHFVMLKSIYSFIYRSFIDNRKFDSFRFK